MALIKTDYGLIYNDDGSLCTTVRTDDVPFQGVSSFAVEEGTTNLLPMDIISDWYIAGNDSNITNEIKLTDMKYLGMSVYELGHVGIATEAVMDRYIGYSFAGLTEGDIYTGSLYVYVYETTSSTPSTNDFWLWYTSNTNHVYLSSLPLNTWVRITTTGTVDSDLKLDYRLDFDNTHMLISAPQLEKKPFATSFVDGTRPGGILEYPANQFDFSNLVMSFWFKFNTISGHDPYPRIYDLGISTTINASDGNGGLYWWGDGLNFIVPGGASIFYPFTVGVNEKQWRFFTVLYAGTDVFTYLSDGNGDIIKKSITSPSVGLNKYPLRFGNASTLNRTANILFSNLLIAEYDPDFWTDDYIKYIYDQKMPFNMQPTVPIV